MDKGVAAVFYHDGIALNGARDTNGTPLADEKWHHVTAVFEGGVNTRLYVDAELKRQTSGTMPTSISPNGDLYIGRAVMTKGWKKDGVVVLMKSESSSVSCQKKTLRSWQQS